MRRSASLAILLALSCIVGSQCSGQVPSLASDYGCDCGCGQCAPCWTFRADALGLQRTETRHQPLFLGGIDTAPSAETAVLDARDLRFPVAPAFQLSAIRHGPCGWDVEVGYFQIDGWIASAAVPGTSLMVTDVNGAAFVVGDAAARYASNFHIGEINVRRSCTDWLTLLAGFRMGELDEHYDAGDLLQSAVLDAATFNHLYGFQIGADAQVFEVGDPLRINVLCKAGIYGNSASQTIREASGEFIESLHANHCQAAFIGEAGLVATYRLTCHLAVRASCQAVWLEGVALAPEQIGTTNFDAHLAAVDTHGGIFYYGAGVGLELTF
jgi:hypothetical protein